jgi:hypothetical protein
VQRWRFAIGIALALATLTACGGGGATKAEQGRSIAEQAGLPKEVADFFALAAAGTQATYRVSLETTDPKGAKLQVTTTQRPPDVRVDTFHSDGTIDSTLSVEGRRYQCTKAGDQWQCGDLGPGAETNNEVFDPAAVQRAIDGFRQRAADYDFRVERRSIANVDATCLVTTRKPGKDKDPLLGAAATLCLSPQGAIVRAEEPSSTLAATSYATDIPADTFTLPAPISSSSPSS